MIPVSFPEANSKFGPPPELDASQCLTIHAWVGPVKGGSLDGATAVVTAWKPSPQDIERMQGGAPIFLACLGGLPPHFLCTDFEEAKNPQ